MSTIITEPALLLPHQGIEVGGVFRGQILRAGKVIDEFEDHNLVVDEGMNSLLNVALNGATPISAWYLGLYEGNYTPVAGLVASAVAATATETTAYAAATRPPFTGATSTAKLVTNSANRGSFVFTAAKTIYGAFLVSTNTKGGTGGVLFSAARFTTAKVVDINDELLLSYSFSGSSL